MDKLENETWEDYAFRNNLFVIKYVHNGKEKTINDIAMPIHTIVNPRHFDVYGSNIDHYNNETSKIGFMDFIMYEVYNLKRKYNTWFYGAPIDCKVEHMTKEREEDINRQKWLFKQLVYWEKKYTDKFHEEISVKNQVDVKTRYFELKSILSERHKEQLDELLNIIRDSSIPLLEGEIKSYMYSDEYWHDRTKQNKKNRIDLYEKYLKNKDIQTQIMELEQKLNQLKSQIVK